MSTFGAVLTKPYPWVLDVLPIAEREFNITVNRRAVLGCAANGCAFDLGNNRVLKLTRDPNEVRLFEIAWRRKSPGVVPSLGRPPVLLSNDIGFARGAVEENKAWAILKPKVKPIQPRPHALDALTYVIIEMRREYPGVDTMNELVRLGATRELKAEYARLLKAAHATRDFPLVTQTLLDWMKEGIYATDTSTSNIGLYGKDFVLFDGGAFETRGRL